MPKLYGCPLKDYPAVLQESEKYPSIRTKYWWNTYTPYRKPPLSFDGRDLWKAYTQLPDEQKCQESWSIVATDVLSDRYTILSIGQLNLFLSAEEIVSCIDKPPLPPLPNVISYSTEENVSIESTTTNTNALFANACQGYSIYDAWEYLYEFGVPELSCFSKIVLQKKTSLADKITFKEKKKNYEGKCDKIQCLSNSDEKLPSARRSFYINGIFNIYDIDEKGKFDLAKTIETIKYELMRFGPVAAGFVIYENFMNEYNGKTIYEKASGKPLGGHYVSIMGWDIDKKTGIEYWICRNSFGTNWGLAGFFKIKIGILECHLEENISGCDPYFHNLNLKEFVSYDTELNNKRVAFNDMNLFNPDLANRRNLFAIDEKTFYPKKTLELIKQGKLIGDLNPLIQYQHNLPDRNYYWAEDFSKYKFITENKNENENDIKIIHKDSHTLEYIFYIILFIICIVIGYRSK